MGGRVGREARRRGGGVRKTARRNVGPGGVRLLVCEKVCFHVLFKGIGGRNLADRERKFVPGHWTCNGKRAGAYCCVFNSGEAERECI